ncbi:antizyme inhibitor 2 isoform X1 [Hydra vulgaris]|uniref:antizyme inhibitor 2 isoform X1 n=1 Tax=Hydra vulgaris TaxID=6087 RepID=UPI001F5EF5B2|nr:antizyme inhibitor 2-like [Hydra vulgaris]XP_047141731.1 antizyme inhibitor 2-like [Hydra vulgaris]
MKTVSLKLGRLFSNDSLIDVCNDAFNMRSYLQSKSCDLKSRECYDDPFYVCDLDDIIEKHLLFQNLLPRIKPFFAVKSNPNHLVIALLARLGVNFDCASKCEIETVLDMDVDPERIIFANPCKQESHVKYAREKNVRKMTFDSEGELYKIKENFPGAELVIRIKVDDSNSAYKLGRKFGASLENTQKLLQLAKDLDLNVIGVSFHVGTGCYDASLFYNAVKSAATVFQQGNAVGYTFTLLDIGGGFPGFKNETISMDNIAAQLNLSLAEFFPSERNLIIIAEPGKYFVESAFTLCCNVISVKEVNDRNKHFMYYLNDGVFSSFIGVLFAEKFKPLLLQESDTTLLFKSSLWGPTCDSSDCISEEMYLPKLSVRDWLYFKNMGAYTTCFASKFNGFNPPVIYYVSTSKIGSIFSVSFDD